MFNKLVASNKGRRRRSPGGTLLSLVAHGLILTGAVYATTRAPVVEEKPEEEVTFLEVEEPPPPPPPEAAPPPPPRTFQELVPPIDPPDFIPEIDETQTAVDLSDFTGIGEVAETAVTETSATRDSTFAYEVAVLDSPPTLANLGEVQQAMTRLYPRMLLNAGIGGTVVVQFVVTPGGAVDPSSVQIVSTPYEELGEASREALESFRFRPGIYKGDPVRVLTQMPIAWQPAS